MGNFCGMKIAWNVLGILGLLIGAFGCCKD